ncbi:hypothetical protein L484_008639 [Morus notabilis]|uniref:Uncharacterized protein n=1 Tax=Morus notabilis TaxID=981085 RepID=W9SB79_9ROSA|nr:hypothetical protein L484_008639 [Morus notabilis]
MSSTSLGKIEEELNGDGDCSRWELGSSCQQIRRCKPDSSPSTRHRSSAPQREPPLVSPNSVVKTQLSIAKHHQKS